MLKALVWTAVAATSGAAAVLVPIDPAILHAIGISDGAAKSPLSGAPRKIISGTETTRLDSRVGEIRAPLVSPYRALPTEKPEQPRAVAPPADHVGRLAIATPPRLIVKPTLAELQPPAPVPISVVRGLQAELRRVGCYRGRIDGDWGPESRFAMAAFVKSINAALPTEQPDTILLSLVRRHPGAACGSRPTGSDNAVTASAGTTVPKANVSKTSGWQVRVAQPAVPAPRRAKASAPIRLTGAPRIVRSDGSSRSTVAVSDPFARTRSLSRPFGESRMSLGVAVPAPTEARRPLTTPGTTEPSAYRRRTNRIRRAQNRSARRASPRARRASLKRRRYYRRRARSRNWRRTVFPNIYN